MFTDTKAFSGFSVDDIDKAAQFYGDVLGLRVTAQDGILQLHVTGNDQPIFVYPKGAQHEPASFTILNFPVADVDAAVELLTAKGITFERLPDTDEKGIMRDNGPTIAWFKDPARNWLSVIGVEV